MRVILPLLLFFKLFANITCNWICEIASKMNAGIPCNPDGIFFCNGKYNNVWTEPERAEVFPAFDKIVCSLLCMSNQCLCMQYLGGKAIGFKWIYQWIYKWYQKVLLLFQLVPLHSKRKDVYSFLRQNRRSLCPVSFSQLAQPTLLWTNLRFHHHLLCIWGDTCKYGI